MAAVLGAENQLNPGWFRRQVPEISRALSAAIFIPDHSNIEPCPHDTYAELVIPVNGAVADDGGVQTDETVAARSGPQVDQQYNAGDDSYRNVSGLNWEAQTFPAGLNCDIRYLRLKLYRSGLPGTVTVSIKAVDGLGHPTGVDLCQATFNGNELREDTNGEWRRIEFATPASLVAGTQYAIVVRCPGSYLRWRVDQTTPAYAGGRREYSSNGGAAWTSDTSRDYMFETYITTNDMTLLPPSPLQVNDAYYWGHANRFYKLIQDIGLAATGTHTVTWEYWDSVGASWASCVDLNDGTDAFRNQWTREVTHTPQANWGLSVVQGMNLYWIRARVTNAGAGYGQPLGAWAKVAVQV
jgi:hypothetical protein